MHKGSFLFLVLLSAAAVLLTYHSSHELPAYVLIVRFLGVYSFLLLSLTIAISPLVSLRPGVFAQLIEPRRAVGIAAFVFALFHFLLAGFFYFDFNPAKSLAQPALVVGAAALLIMLALALTSSDYAVRALGNSSWKLLQKLNYLAFALVFAHFIMKSNGLFGAKALNFAEVFLLLSAALAVALRVAALLKKK